MLQSYTKGKKFSLAKTWKLLLRTYSAENLKKEGKKFKIIKNKTKLNKTTKYFLNVDAVSEFQ